VLLKLLEVDDSIIDLGQPEVYDTTVIVPAVRRGDQDVFNVFFEIDECPEMSINGGLLTIWLWGGNDRLDMKLVYLELKNAREAKTYCEVINRAFENLEESLHG